MSDDEWVSKQQQTRDLGLQGRIPEAIWWKLKIFGGTFVKENSESQQNHEGVMEKLGTTDPYISGRVCTAGVIIVMISFTSPAVVTESRSYRMLQHEESP